MAAGSRHSGMRRIRGGQFAMGSADFYADEAPVRVAEVSDFWIDETPVTNADFARFVAATGHVTVAERAPDPADYPDMAPECAVAGSIVFTPPPGPVELGATPSWWSYVAGADWAHPLGPGSAITAIRRHPVVHIAYADALAYAQWAGKALPSEAQWEFAARGGLEGKAYAWGDDFMPGGQRRAKTWDGLFPWHNAAPPGLERTSPVKSYPANGYGLFDMIGNVWEWTRDGYDAAAVPGASCCGGAAASGRPQGAARRVLKGGSHLCAPEYCQRYRPAARWPQPEDTSTSHVGFRCVMPA